MWTALLTFIVQEERRVAALQKELDTLDQALVVYTWLRKRGISAPEEYRAELAPQASQALRRWAAHMTRSSAPPAVASWVSDDSVPDFLEAKLREYIRREIRTLQAGGKEHQLPPLPLPYEMYAQSL